MDQGDRCKDPMSDRGSTEYFWSHAFMVDLASIQAAMHSVMSVERQKNCRDVSTEIASTESRIRI